MDESSLRRFTAGSGLAFGLLHLLEVPLYFVQGYPPPDTNVLTRVLVSLLVLACLIGFASGLRHLVPPATPARGWVAELAYGAALTYVAITLVAHSLQAGAVIAEPAPVDPTITAPGTYLLYGSVGRLLTAIYLAAFGYAVARSGLLGPWARWSAYAIAAVNLAFVPSLYFGNDTASFYSSNGWGTTAVVAGLASYWAIAVGVALLRVPGVRGADPPHQYAEGVARGQ